MANPIKEAMQRKVNHALGEVEHQIDKFLSNQYKSNFKMEKYLGQIEFRPKLVAMFREEYQPLLAELKSDDPDFVEGYSFMTKPEKKRFIKFIESIIEGCDTYVQKNQAKWDAETAMKRMNTKMRKARAKRMKIIEETKGRKTH